MKSIEEANLTDHKNIMLEAKELNNIEAFNNVKESATTTLEAIKNTDSKTYIKYSHLLNEEY